MKISTNLLQCLSNNPRLHLHILFGEKFAEKKKKKVVFGIWTRFIRIE
jgi:hypothetical protein